VQVEIKREHVTVAGTFQIIEGRKITYYPKLIWNMWTQDEIWDHFFREDKRLPPFECYQEWEEPRPYAQNIRPEFLLKDTSDALDTLGHDGGVDGGINPNGWIPPAISKPPPRREHTKDIALAAGNRG
jgi:hypothetical protein